MRTVFFLAGLLVCLAGWNGVKGFAVPVPDCPPGVPRVICPIDPCTVSRCGPHPSSLCVPDFCGGCNVRFLFQGVFDITHICGPQPMIEPISDCLVEGQVFSNCASACPATCSNPFPFCTRECVAQCECPGTMVIDESIQICVPIRDCPPSVTLPPPTPSTPPACPVEGQVFSTCASACSATCSDPSPICNTGCVEQCECPGGTVIDETIQKCVPVRDCPASVTAPVPTPPPPPACLVEGQVFSTCASACPATCSDPSPFCNTGCVEQCECPQGTVIDETIQKCVPVRDCPASVTTPVPTPPPPACPVEGQVFSTCASACPATCSDPSPFCNTKCVEQCECPGGTVIDETIQKCVPVRDCPASVTAPVPTPPPPPACPVEGQVFSTCASACPATCSDPFPFCNTGCVAQCECPQGTVIDETIQKCVPVRDCPASVTTPVPTPPPPPACPVEGQVFSTCASACPATCSDPFPICNTGCVEQCKCPRGTVIDEEINRCVAIDECPLDYDSSAPECPMGLPLFMCFVDPCLVADCPQFPTAACFPEFCGGCTARFFLGELEVTWICGAPPLPPPVTTPTFTGLPPVAEPTLTAKPPVATPTRSTRQPVATPTRTTRRSVAMPTPTRRPVVTPTPTRRPVATATPTRRPVATLTRRPVATPTRRPMVTPTPTRRPVATATSTRRPVATPTRRPVATPTRRPVATPTPTRRPVATATPTRRPVATPTRRPVATATPTRRPVATPTRRPMATPTPTIVSPITTPPPTLSPTPIACPVQGQVFTSCASACPATCSDTSPCCTKRCVAQCECPGRMVIDETIQKCVPVDNCPPACPVEGQVFSTCASACPATCSDPSPICNTGCVEHCECPGGMVIDETNQKCVPVADCPNVSMCPPGVPSVTCVVDPCLNAVCLLHRTAVCEPDFCGECRARFYLGNFEVTSSCHSAIISRLIESLEAERQ